MYRIICIEMKGGQILLFSIEFNESFSLKFVSINIKYVVIELWKHSKC